MCFSSFISVLELRIFVSVGNDIRTKYVSQYVKTIVTLWDN